jgi:hypothetical protein
MPRRGLAHGKHEVKTMLALHSGATGIEHVEAVAVLIAIFVAIFWRDVLKILLLVALLLFVILMATGAVAIVDVLQHAIK